jgi:hypothetical protein
MSSENTDQVQLPENRPRFITCFIHYSDNDNQEQIFEVLKTFRKEKGLKFSHHRGYIFFTLLSTYLDEFSKVRPFKISRFQTKSEYKCTKEVADKLMSQKDSFIRMNWSDEDSILTFLSRTTSRIHGQLVRRIFNDSQQEFVRTEYRVLKDENVDSISQEEKDRTPVQEESQQVDGFTRVVDKKVIKRTVAKEKKETETTTVRDKTKYRGRPKKTEEASEKPMIRGKKSAQA